MGSQRFAQLEQADDDSLECEPEEHVDAPAAPFQPDPPAHRLHRRVGLVFEHIVRGPTVPKLRQVRAETLALRLSGDCPVAPSIPQKEQEEQASGERPQDPIHLLCLPACGRSIVECALAPRDRPPSPPEQIREWPDPMPEARESRKRWRFGLTGKSVEYPVIRALISSGCGLAARHVLWDHEIVGSNPTAPTSSLLPMETGERPPAR